MMKMKNSSGKALVILGRASPTQFASNDTATSPNARFWLDNLSLQLGSRKKAKRKGKDKGQKSRSSPSVRRGFEGGQMPLYRRIRKLRGIARGKCLEVRGEIHEAHEIVLQSLSVLVSRNAFSAHSSVPLNFLLDLIGKDIPGDPLAIDCAAILYNICCFTLKSYPCNAGSYSDHRFFRYGYNRHCWSKDEKAMKNNFTWTQIGGHKKRRLSFSPQACFALVTTRNSSLTNFYQEVIEAAREKFTWEISFQSKDKDISFAKSPGLLVALLVWLSAATLEWLCIAGLRCCVGIVALSWLLCCLCSAVLVFPAAVCSAAMLACCRAAGC